MKQPINEKRGFSKVATVAIAALINSRISGLKKQVNALQPQIQALSKASKADKTDVTKSQQNLEKVEKQISDLTAKIKNTPSQPTTNKKEESDKIRKLIRMEVGRILFDIYKLRNTWKTV